MKSLIFFIVTAVIGQSVEDEQLVFLKNNGQKDGVETLESGLQYTVLRSGSGERGSDSSFYEVHYSGKLINGFEFDSSYKRGETITLTPKQVIAGWMEALQLMREGDKWELVIPSRLAYGNLFRPCRMLYVTLIL